MTSKKSGIILLKKGIILFKFLIFSLSLSTLLLADDNRTKELEEWLKFGFTNGDVVFIAEYISKIEHKNYILEKRITNLEKSLLKQNEIIKTLLVKKCKTKKISSNNKKYKKTTKFKPSVFITKKFALLYDKPNGKAFMNFPANYKFTAYERVGEWIRVSGHFPDKKWRKTEQNIWIKQSLIKKIK